jgi:hypothetical protein
MDEVCFTEDYLYRVLDHVSSELAGGGSGETRKYAVATLAMSRQILNYLYDPGILFAYDPLGALEERCLYYGIAGELLAVLSHCEFADRAEAYRFRLAHTRHPQLDIPDVVAVGLVDMERSGRVALEGA